MIGRLKSLIMLAVLIGAGYLIFQNVPQVRSTVYEYVGGVKDTLSLNSSESSTGTLDTSGALATLNTIPVKGRAPATGYSRAQFGDAWTDNNDVPLGRNGCRTREDILARDMTQVYHDGCKVTGGVINDPYTGKTITFTRGAETSSEVQIDHVVALKNAWVTGAQQLTPRQRVNLANDPLNLLAVDGITNQAKGDGDAATWLPPNKSFRCAYVSRQISVKAKYRLWVTAPEKSAMTRILNSCS